jgi:hypothetical protein
MNQEYFSEGFHTYWNTYQCDRFLLQNLYFYFYLIVRQVPGRLIYGILLSLNFLVYFQIKPVSAKSRLSWERPCNIFIKNLFWSSLKHFVTLANFRSGGQNVTHYDRVYACDLSYRDLFHLFVFHNYKISKIKLC